VAKKPMFQRRHYVSVAEVLRQWLRGELHYDIAAAFADMFERDGPRGSDPVGFDRARFMEAVHGKNK
jgi:hypothetical protein